MPAKKNSVATHRPVAAPISFTKSKILTMQRYAGRRDLLTALLKENEQYTKDQVDTMIQNFMKKGKVK